MKKSSLTGIKKEEGLNLPEKGYRFKQKGIIYRIDWNISISSDNQLTLPADQKILNIKK